MKGFWLKLFLFIFCNLSIMYIVGRLDNSCNKDIQIRRLKDAFQKDSLDFLFLGNSHSFNGVIPDSVCPGKKVFNLGMPAASIFTLELIFEQIKATKMRVGAIIINLGPEMFADGADDFARYPYHRYFPNPYSNEHLFFKGLISRSEYLTLTFKSFKSGLRRGILQNCFLGDTAQHKNGYIPRDGFGTDSVYLNQGYIYQKFMSCSFNSDKANRLLSLIDEMSKSGIKVTIHEMPDFKLRNYFSKDFLQDLDSFFLDLGEIVPTFRLRNSVSSSIHFADSDHLNHSGAVIYSKVLRDSLFLHETVNQ